MDVKDVVRAMRDEVIVKQVLSEKKGSFFIPETKGARMYNAEFYGEVISVGPKCKKDIKPGDKLLYRRHEGKKIYYKGVEYFVLKDRWVECVLTRGDPELNSLEMDMVVEDEVNEEMVGCLK